MDDNTISGIISASGCLVPVTILTGFSINNYDSNMIKIVQIIILVVLNFNQHGPSCTGDYYHNCDW